MSVTLAATPALEAETVKVPRRLALIGLVLLLCAALVVLAIGLLIVNWRNPHAWLATLPAVAFFGWAFSVLLRRVVSGWSMTIGPDGFTIPGPAFQSKLVRWSDVEAIDAAEFGKNKIGRGTNVAIRLRSYENLASQYSAEEIRAMQRRNRFLAAAPVHTHYTPYTGVSAEDFVKAGKATAPAPDIAGIFANRRAAYGYDIVLTAGDVDRNADDFAVYLNSFRKRYAPDTFHA